MISLIKSYHADTTRASKSALDIIHRSPFEYYCRNIDDSQVPAYVKEQWDSDTRGRHFAIGSALDKWLLENSTFFDEWFVTTDRDRRYKDGKDDHLRILAENPGKDFVTPHEFQMVKDMAAALKNSGYGHLIDPSRSQQTVHWTDANSGMPCKCRPDWRHEVAAEDYGTDFASQFDEVVWDLKTIDNPAKWASHVADYRYHVQEAFYLDGVTTAMNDGKRRKFMFMIVGTAWPHPVMIQSLPDFAVQRGRSEYQLDLEMLRLCRETNEWPKPETVWEETKMPYWFSNQI